MATTQEFIYVNGVSVLIYCSNIVVSKFLYKRNCTASQRLYHFLPLILFLIYLATDSSANGKLSQHQIQFVLKSTVNMCAWISAYSNINSCRKHEIDCSLMRKTYVE